MGARFPSGSTASNPLPNIVTTSETIVATTAPLSTTVDNGLIIVNWYVVLTIGTAGTALTARLRRGGTLTGSVINIASALTVVAGNTVQVSGTYGDLPGVTAALQYALTLQLTAATGNSQVLDASMNVIEY